MNKARLAVLLAAALLPLTPAAAPATAGMAATVEHPNVVFVLTDDMRYDDMKYMRFTRRLFADTGTTFTKAISPHPLCCPARAELVTGQYAQNNGVHHNTGPWGGYQALADRNDLIFNWLQSAQYRTAYFGKYINGYAGQDPVPGLTYNDISIRRIYSPYGVVTFNNGSPVQRSGHQTYSVTRSVNRMIGKYAGDPFFIWAGYVAPHGMLYHGKWGPSVPPREYNTFHRPGHARPQSFGKPSFNVAQPVQHKRRRPRAKVIADHVGRVKSLYAVDDAVREIVRTLKEKGVWSNTILAFTSDNGFGLGAHRTKGKNDPYQDSVRVPLMMTGPGIPHGEIGSVVTLVDLPATLARLTGATATRVLDGADMFNQPQDRAVLIQGGSAQRPWGWRGVYTKRFTFVKWYNGQTELYDRKYDPYELRNRRHYPVKRRLAALAEQLATCAGQDCQRTFGA